MFVNFHISVTLIVELLAKSKAPNVDPNVDQCRPTASPRLALRAEPQRSTWRSHVRSLTLRGREIWVKGK